MIQKTTSITPPLDDFKVVALEAQLATLFTNALQCRVGTFTGDGRTSRTLTLGIKALFLYIQKFIDPTSPAILAAGFPIAGNGTFSLRDMPGVTYVPGTGFVNDAVKSYTSDGVTLGSNANVNQVGTQYLFFAIG